VRSSPDASTNPSVQLINVEEQPAGGRSMHGDLTTLHEGTDSFRRRCEVFCCPLNVKPA